MYDPKMPKQSMLVELNLGFRMFSLKNGTKFICPKTKLVLISDVDCREMFINEQTKQLKRKFHQFFLRSNFRKLDRIRDKKRGNHDNSKKCLIEQRKGF